MIVLFVSMVGGGLVCLRWPDSVKRCSDFSTQRQAQAYYAGQDLWSGDYPDIDPDNDGNACEDLP